jgi:hypothetical protein
MLNRMSGTVKLRAICTARKCAENPGMSGILPRTNGEAKIAAGICSIRQQIHSVTLLLESSSLKIMNVATNIAGLNKMGMK